MPILQEQPPERGMPSRIEEASLDPPRDLEYPHAPVHAMTRNSTMSLTLWSLALTLGILMLLVRMPLNAPQFEQLTQYVCDPLPRLPLQLNRLGTYPLEFKCRAGDQVLYQRQAVINRSNPSGLNACKQEGGLMRIWRMPPSSAYGAYVFHTTCGNHIIMYYKNRAAVYESIQRFVIAIACIVIVVSATGLGRKMLPRKMA
jgi:hypothetical protein